MKVVHVEQKVSCGTVYHRTLVSKVNLTLRSVNENLKFYNSNEIFLEVFSCCTVYYAL